MSEAAGALVHTPASITDIRRAQFTAEQVDLIRATVAPECNDAELAVFLEVCARHELDPFIKEVWSIRWKANQPTQTVVAKDGLLKVANRCTGKGWFEKSGEYIGCFSGAVFEKDHFSWHTERDEDGHLRCHIDHRPAQDGNALNMSERGALVGSFAVVSRRGHSDYWYVASRAEYGKTEQAWKTHPTAMMVKVAEALALRKAFPIAGVVGEGELESSTRVVVGSATEAATDEVLWPEDEELTGELKAAFEVLGYRSAKVRALVNAASMSTDPQQAWRELLTRLNNEADAGGDGGEEAITDAEVVGS